MIRKGSILLVCSILSAFAAWAQGGPEVSQAGQHDVSQPLGEIPPVPPKPGHREKPWRLTQQLGPSNRPDPVVQTSAGPLVGTTAGVSIAGVGNGDYGFVPDAAPPDTNGAVGATQVVQWVNESFAVFNKSTGAKVYGPAAGNTLWSGFGGGCQTNNDGDPIIQYDKANGRWIFTQFSVTTLPYLQCVAVSTTSDATGTYNRYAFSYGNKQFPDYPKLGVWPDAYYISFNIFNNGVSFAGAKVCAYDGAKMRTGAAATQVCFQLGTSVDSLLPSDLDGSMPPPAGSPNFFLNFGSNKLNLWKFHVDFVTPGNSTFTGPTSIPVAAFSAACSGGGACIPQLGATSSLLDSLGDRLMYRLAYRNFGDHESLVVNHSVTAGSSVGVRWYELRSPGSTPTVFQQSTYAPDSLFRWMGSIAMDRSGNMALGYSISSSAMNPGIRFTGRLATDAANTMQAENVIVSGTGSQTGGLNRWGDYSSMSVDPVDDCTFWYTNEYLKADGSFNWSTRIASFKFPGCGSTAPDFSLSASPSSQTVVRGTNSPTYTVTISPLNGFAGAVTLSASGLPAGAGASFSPNPATTSSTLTVTTTAALTAGSYPFTITGISGALTHSTTATLVVSDFSLSASPSSQTVVQGAGTSYTVNITRLQGFTGAVSFSVSGLPSGASGSFSPNPTSTSGTSSTLTITTISTTPISSSLLTITGTSGTLIRMTTATLVVSATPPPDFSLSASPASQTVVQGAGTTYTVSIARLGGFTGSVSFTVTGLPSGAGSTLPSTSGTSSTLSITTSAATPTGTFPLTITGTGSGVPTHMTSVTLVVNTAACTNGNCNN